MNKAALAQLGNFNGTEAYHRLSIAPSFVCTDGAKFLAENADCFWLMDEIGFAQSLPKIRGDSMLQQHQFWTLRENPPAPKPMTVGAVLASKTKEQRGQAVLVCERDSGDVAWTKQIPFTDFPFECFEKRECRIWVAPTAGPDGRRVMVAYLPSEH